MTVKLQLFTMLLRKTSRSMKLSRNWLNIWYRDYSSLYQNLQGYAESSRSGRKYLYRETVAFRDEHFFSLVELDRAIKEKLELFPPPRNRTLLLFLYKNFLFPKASTLTNFFPFLIYIMLC